MPKYSDKSAQRLATCDQRLQDIFNELIKEYDCTILCGERGEAEQNEAYATGRSKAKWPQSKHNTSPSRAVDAAPYPVDWNNHTRFSDMAARVQVIADKFGTKIRWGGTFSKLKDLPHFELV